MLRVALTGGTAAGKSHCLQRFAAHDVPVIDADVLAREVVMPGTPGPGAIAERFGGGVLARMARWIVQRWAASWLPIRRRAR